MSAGAVERSECPSLGAGGDPSGAPNMEHLTGGAKHHRENVGLAAEPPDGLDRERDAIDRLADRGRVNAIDERRPVDEDLDLGDSTCGGR